MELSSKEYEILILISKGYSTKEICMEIHRSRRTVEGYRSDLLNLFNAKSKIDLLRNALKYGYFDKEILHKKKKGFEYTPLRFVEIVVLHEYIRGKSIKTVSKGVNLSYYKCLRAKQKIYTLLNAKTELDLIINSYVGGYIKLVKTDKNLVKKSDEEIWNIFQNFKSNPNSVKTPIYEIEYVFPIKDGSENVTPMH